MIEMIDINPSMEQGSWKAPTHAMTHPNVARRDVSPRHYRLLWGRKSVWTDMQGICWCRRSEKKEQIKYKDDRMYQKVRKKREWTEEDASSWPEEGEDDWEQPLQPCDACGASRVYQEMEQQLCTLGRKFCSFPQDDFRETLPGRL